MADTRQVVVWALERGCTLRTGEAVADIGKAFGAVNRVRYCCECVDGKRLEGRYPAVVGDVCVTGLTNEAEPPKGTSHRGLWYPNSGMLVSETLKSVGGIEGVSGMCGSCPAHVRVGRAAGCVGVLRLEARSDELERSIREAVEQLGLEEAMRQHFLPTRPMWYGLWVKSPLSAEAAGILRRVLEEVLRSLAGERAEEIRGFVKALAAAEGGQRLHVVFGAPGHTDFGAKWNWPHCPRCKAQWKDQFLKKPVDVTCAVCGERYRWRDEMRNEREDVWEDRPGLREMLGEGFAAWAKDFFVAAGYEERVAAEIVRLTEEKVEREREPGVREAQMEARRVRDRARPRVFWLVCLGIFVVSAGLGIWVTMGWGWGEGVGMFVGSVLSIGTAAGQVAERQSAGKLGRWLENKE
ncbi:MAG: hypothetical protein ACTHN5_11640 [Phycisphaerae bacterium]